ncbi:hypothetical protein AUEXF2481DRAFT_8431 [Aureobasidium subglaciale EXF-2481]|uniref:Mei2-like C-terminal RNA recognition motif domain-containing protein n=1 Tax=Aureobasidium subglaciale (strain EXF-2481) TaxID=1043005 RepID=A0A074YBM6_AURSE|nr:uncharacterized protein AUEXF2481DRAFT_8431 [Aureobasidium subglaciale EXF-2481]KEQ91562.1 hypothetical protein AUEXF2481DRAFT_8431 [Aureobasidium subglaciale EXF-2481]
MKSRIHPSQAGLNADTCSQAGAGQATASEGRPHHIIKFRREAPHTSLLSWPRPRRLPPGWGRTSWSPAGVKSQRAQPRDETSVGHYDFSYLRIDFSNNFKGGYAFVNFCKPEYITSSVRKRVGHPWGMYGSLTKCEVSYATI